MLQFTAGRALLLAISLCFISACSAANSVAQDAIYYVANTRPPDAFLALRTAPSSSTGQRIAVLTNGTKLRILDRRSDGWWRVQVTDSGDLGWVLSARGDSVWVVCCANQQTATASSLKPTSQPIPRPTLTPQPTPPTQQANTHDQFTQLLGMPASCEAVRAGGPSNCPATIACKSDLAQQAEATLQYLSQNQTIIGKMRQLRLLSGVGSYQAYDDGLLRELSAITKSFGNNVAVTSCSYVAMIIDREWVSLRQDGRGRRPLEQFMSAGRSLLERLKSDFDSDEREYRALREFNDAYDGVARFDQSYAQYRRSITEFDITDAIKARDSFQADLELAKVRKALLAQQSSQIERLLTRVRDLSENYDRSALAETVASLTGLQNMPASTRGDASNQLTAFETVVAKEQEKFKRANDLEQRRLTAVAMAEQARNEFSEQSSRASLTTETVALLDGLAKQKEELVRQASTKLSERTDYTSIVIAAEVAIKPLLQAKRDLSDLKELNDSFSQLDDRINARGAQFLDAETSAQLRELRNIVSTLSAQKSPLGDEARQKALRGRSLYGALDASIDPVMDREQQRQETARKVAALDPEIRVFIEKRPEFQPNANADFTASVFTEFLGAEVPLEVCVERAWFSPFRAPLRELQRRKTMLEAILQLQGIPETKIVLLKVEWAKAKEQVKAALKASAQNVEEQCMQVSANMSLNGRW